MMWQPPETTHPDTPLPYTTRFRLAANAGIGKSHQRDVARAAFARIDDEHRLAGDDDGAGPGAVAARQRRSVAAKRDVQLVGQAGKTVTRGMALRSAELTSELQSPMRTSYAVFCLKTTKTSTS